MKQIFWTAMISTLAAVGANAQIVAGGFRGSQPNEKAIDSVNAVRVATLYEKKVFMDGADSLPYRILLPELYDSAKQYPLVMFLHDAGGQGRDNEKQLANGGSLFVKDDNLRKFHSIVVFPQCPPESQWSNAKMSADAAGKKAFEFSPAGDATKAMDMAIKLEKHLLESYPVNKEKVYLMGISEGAMGVYEMVRRMPNTFAAAIPIGGGADTSTARQIKKTAFWIIHGARDEVVSYKNSENMAMAIQKFYSAAEMQYSIYPDANHSKSWETAFKDPELLTWMFSQMKMK
jgi:predicted peptidase